MTWTTMSGASAVGLLVALASTLMPTAPKLGAYLAGQVRPALPVDESSSLSGLYEDLIRAADSSASSSHALHRSSLPASAVVLAPVHLRPQVSPQLKLSGPTELQALDAMPDETHPFMKSVTISTQPSVGQRLQRAIGDIAADPNTIHTVLESIFDQYYDRAAPDLHAVLRNLVTLQRAVVVYDLARRIDARLGDALRRHRYDVEFAALRRHHERIGRRALSRAYWAVANDGVGRDAPDADFTCHRFHDGGGRQRVFISVQAIIDEAIAEVGAGSGRAGPALRFDYDPSPFHSEIYDIHTKVLAMIDDVLRPDDTPFGPVAAVKSPYTTKELRDLKASVMSAADDDAAGALYELNVALEAGLYGEYGAGRARVTQRPVHRALLQDLVHLQQRLTRDRVVQLCIDLFHDEIGDDEAALVEYATHTLLEEGVVSADQLTMDSFPGPSLPVLRYDDRGSWESVFIPLQMIVEFAVSMASTYKSQLIIDRDQDGNPLFLYMSNPMAGRHLVRTSLLEHLRRPSTAGHTRSL